MKSRFSHHLTPILLGLSLFLASKALSEPSPIPTVTPAASAETPLASGSSVVETPEPILPPLTDVSAPTPEQTQAAPASSPVLSGSAAESVVLQQEVKNLGVGVVPPVNGALNEFQGEEIGSVLRLLARQAKVNLVVSERIAGTVTMRLERMSPLQAIQVIVTSKNLIMDEVGGVYYVKTQEEKAKEPTVSGSYTFSYASAGKAAMLLESQLQGGQKPQVDERTNTVFYREIKSNLENIQLFLSTIDKPTQQVMIEARLVEVNANPKQSYGIDWTGVFGGTKIGLAGSDVSSSSSSRSSNGSSSSSSSSSSTSIATLPDGTGLEFNSNASDSLAGSGDSLASSSISNSFSNAAGAFVGKFSKNGLSAIGGQYAILSAPELSVTLNLLNSDRTSEFLANPRVVTANNQKANIKITRTQPVPQLNFNEQTATAVFGGFQDKEYGNTLEVTPTINKDKFINLLVKPEISNKVRDETFRFGGADVSSPVIDKRTLESNVLIESGKTLAIGGLLQDETGKVRTKVPVLGDIPLLGYLFQSRTNEKIKRNLLIFVTPTIIDQYGGTGLEDQIHGLKDSHEEVADSNGWRNNAQGAIRVVPTSKRQLSAEYPVHQKPKAKAKTDSTQPELPR